MSSLVHGGVRPDLLSARYWYKSGNYASEVQEKKIASEYINTSET